MAASAIRMRENDQPCDMWTTYTLSLAHLMEVGPPSDNDYLGIAGVAQVSGQLPLSRAVPAHVEEDLDDDEHYDHSVMMGRGRRRRRTNRVTPLVIHTP